MHTIIHNAKPARRPATPPAENLFRSPQFDSRMQDGALRLTVYVPGVTAAGVEIIADGTDVTVTARKPHPVRTNWSALQLERAQLDYQLRLRLGRSYNYSALTAEINDGVLTLTLPEKVPSVSARTGNPVACVA